MSFSIRIGGQVGAPHHESLHGVHYLEREDAPKFDGDEMTASTNERNIGYGAWGTFCREVGLHDLFFSKANGLMREHPGCAPLREEHVARVADAIAKWKAAHPATEPGWDANQDPNLARLLWLEGWMRWATGNCDKPALSNC